MKAIHVVGRQSNGKTTLICELLGVLRRRGLKVGTIKHSSHDHELDRPGKDSYRHRHAGADPAGIVTAGLMAVYIPRPVDVDPLEVMEPAFRDCDLVLVEGFIGRKGLTVEVWRREVGKPLLADEWPSIIAVISDDDPPVTIPVWPRRDLERLADEILKVVGLS